MRPACARITGTQSRSSVLLPAPSGPTMPRISPGSTSSETSSSAVSAPYAWRTPETSATGISVLRAGRRRRRLAEADVDGHSRLQALRLVFDGELHREDLLHTLVGRLHVARRELRL